jgi:hypothetical protein
MSKRASRGKHSICGPLSSGLSRSWVALTGSPLRAAVIAALSLAAIWLVSTTSLPYALAPAYPDAALALNPNNPAALVAKAETARARLLVLLGAGLENPKAGQEEGPQDEAKNTLSRLPEVKSPVVEQSGERERLRAEMRDLALRAIANDPLNAQAYRLLAEATSNADRVRLFMGEAFKRSRRETMAAFWLLNDSVYRQDYKAAVRFADIVLRTQPSLDTFVIGYLSLLAEMPDARPLLVERLAAGPAWRKNFFNKMPASVKNPETLLSIMTALRESNNVVLNREMAPYLDFLVSSGRVDFAYNVWLQFLPPAQLDSLGLLTNANFDRKPSGFPFDWEIEAGSGALTEIGEGAAGNGLHISFGEGRVKFPPVRQVVFLTPGRYRLEGKLRGAISGKRGLRWRLHCLYGSSPVLGETEMLMGRTAQWRVFSLEGEVPESADCRGQMIRLTHDARSASEELVSGEVWFSDLRLERVQPQTVQWAPVQ